jgi:hypothetical protein
MKKLPKTWFVDIHQKEPLIDVFKTWYNDQNNTEHFYSMQYYGQINGEYDCLSSASEIISVQEWYDCVFGLQFEEGERVLVRDNEWKNPKLWIGATFIAEFNGKFIVDTGGYVHYFAQCKKKQSELDIKIEELRKLADKRGVKLTIITE